MQLQFKLPKLRMINSIFKVESLETNRKTKSLSRLFVQSGFYDYVITKAPKVRNNNKLLIHEITNNRVEPDIAKRACLLGLRHTFKNEEIFEPLWL